MTNDKNNLDKKCDNNEPLSGNTDTFSRGEHPSSKANLRPWKKGESGNPDGRPHRYNGLKKALESLLDEEVSDWNIDFGSPDGPRRLRILIGFLNKAHEGSLSHIQFLAGLGCFDEKEKK